MQPLLFKMRRIQYNCFVLLRFQNAFVNELNAHRFVRYTSDDVKVFKQLIGEGVQSLTWRSIGSLVLEECVHALYLRSELSVAKTITEIESVFSDYRRGANHVKIAAFIREKSLDVWVESILKHLKVKIPVNVSKESVVVRQVPLPLQELRDKVFCDTFLSPKGCGPSTQLDSELHLLSEIIHLKTEGLDFEQTLIEVFFELSLYLDIRKQSSSEMRILLSASFSFIQKLFLENLQKQGYSFEKVSKNVSPTSKRKRLQKAYHPEVFLGYYLVGILEANGYVFTITFPKNDLKPSKSFVSIPSYLCVANMEERRLKHQLHKPLIYLPSLRRKKSLKNSVTTELGDSVQDYITGTELSIVDIDVLLKSFEDYNMVSNQSISRKRHEGTLRGFIRAYVLSGISFFMGTTVDRRGRTYYRGLFLNPQSNSTLRPLFRFPCFQGQLVTLDARSSGASILGILLGLKSSLQATHVLIPDTLDIDLYIEAGNCLYSEVEGFSKLEDTLAEVTGQDKCLLDRSHLKKIMIPILFGGGLASEVFKDQPWYTSELSGYIKTYIGLSSKVRSVVSKFVGMTRVSQLLFRVCELANCARIVLLKDSFLSSSQCYPLSSFKVYRIPTPYLRIARASFGVQESSEQIHMKLSKKAIVANFVQSIDASLMHRVVFQLIKEKIPVIVIHDCFLVPEKHSTFVQQAYVKAVQKFMGESHWIRNLLHPLNFPECDVLPVFLAAWDKDSKNIPLQPKSLKAWGVGLTLKVTKVDANYLKIKQIKKRWKEYYAIWKISSEIEKSRSLILQESFCDQPLKIEYLTPLKI